MYLLIIFIDIIDHHFHHHILLFRTTLSNHQHKSNESVVSYAFMPALPHTNADGIALRTMATRNGVRATFPVGEIGDVTEAILLHGINDELKIFHFHLWKVRFNISSPPLKSTLSIQRRFSPSKEILCARWMVSTIHTSLLV